MEYRWNLVELKTKRLLAKMFKLDGAYNQFSDIIKQYDLSGEFTKDDFLIRDTLETIDYDKIVKDYLICAKCINDDIYNLCTDMFSQYVTNLDLFALHEYETNNFSNRDLVLYAGDIIKSLNNLELYKYYQWLLRNNKINIIECDEEKLRGNSEMLQGITLRDYMFGTSYINIFRNHTIEDVTALVHEVMHAFYNYVDRNNNDDPKIFMELEGEFGTYLAQTKMEEDGYKEASIMKREELDYKLQKSMILMVNHVLLLTSDDHHFNLDIATKKLNEITYPIKISLTEDDLKNYFSINAYLEVSDIVCYLTMLDIMYKWKSSEALEKIASLKEYDGYDLLENLEYHGITFYNDGLANFTKEFNKTKKLTM